MPFLIILHISVQVKVTKMSSVEKVFSERGKQLLVVDGYKFSFQKLLSNGTKRWCCASRKTNCKAFLKSDGVDSDVIEISNAHNHKKVEQSLLNRQTVSNTLKRKATEDICARPSKIIQTELRKSDIDTITIQDVQLIRKNLYNARRSTMPVIPKSLMEVHTYLSENVIKTNKNENFVMKNDIENHIVMLCCETTIKFVASVVDELYVDGTFEYAPRWFLQLFSVHGFWNGNYIPLVFFLLPDKSTHSYKTALSYLKEECTKINPSYHPKIITADFEVAIQRSIEQVFPFAKIRGCRFHLGQSWYRKIQQLGLSAEYIKSNTPISNYLTYVFGLPLLDPEDVGDCFAFDLAAIQPDNPAIQAFADYLVNNYIAEDAMFSPQIWAENTSSIRRTTNACESFHAKLNASFYSAHPNIMVFINILLDFQTQTYIKQRSLIPSTPRRKVLKKQQFLEQKIQDLHNNKINQFEFVKTVSYHFRHNML